MDRRKKIICALYICVFCIALSVLAKKMEMLEEIWNGQSDCEASEETKAVDTTDYSQYMRKIWVVKGWNDWNTRGYEAPSFRIDRIVNGQVEGRFEVAWLAADNWTQNFEGTIQDGVVECKFSDDGNEGTISMKFETEEEIEAEVQYEGRCETYVFRPYNLADISDFALDEEQSFWADLSAWGNIYFAVGIMETRHPYPLAFLVNENQDILFTFIRGNWINGTEIYDVSVEDLNGDHLEDVRFQTCFSEDPEGMPHMEKIFLQEEDGFFERYTMYEKCGKSIDSFIRCLCDVRLPI